MPTQAITAGFPFQTVTGALPTQGFLGSFIPSWTAPITAPVVPTQVLNPVDLCTQLDNQTNSGVVSGLLDSLLGEQGALGQILGMLLSKNGVVGGLLSTLGLGDLLSALGLDSDFGTGLSQLLENLTISLGLQQGSPCSQLIDTNTGQVVNPVFLQQLLAACMNPIYSSTSVCSDVYNSVVKATGANKSN